MTVRLLWATNDDSTFSVSYQRWQYVLCELSTMTVCLVWAINDDSAFSVNY